MIFKLSNPALVFRIGAVALGLHSACAQTPAPSVTPTPVPTFKKPVAYLRLWNMAIAMNAPLEVSTGTEASGRPILTALPANFYTGYQPIAPGHYSLRLAKSSDPKTSLRMVDATIPDKGYFTIFVSQKPTGELVSELINESIDPSKPVNNMLTVRQFSQGAKVVVTADKQHTGPLEFGDVQVLEQLPSANVPITMRALTSKGPRNWAAEMDFKTTHRGTVFVYPDTYGRIRFKLTADGPSPSIEGQ